MEDKFEKPRIFYSPDTGSGEGGEEKHEQDKFETRKTQEQPQEPEKPESKNEEELSPEAVEKIREINPEIVEGVEKSALHTEAKINLLLVEGGVKPAASIGLVLRNGENQFVSEEQLEDIKSLLGKAGMAYFIGDKSVSEAENGSIFEEVEIIVSQTKADLDKILEIGSRMSHSQQIINNNDREKENQAQTDFGLAMGYPLTAVQSFIAGSEPLAKDSFPEEIKQGDAYLFCQYQLSKDNWQQELQTSQEWADFIRRTSPKIYEQYKKEQTDS